MSARDDDHPDPASCAPGALPFSGRGPGGAVSGFSAMRRLPQAVVFDWDNTLIDNWDALLSAMNAALGLHGKPQWDRGQMIAASRRSLRDGFPDIFGGSWKKARDIFYRHYDQNHLKGLKVLPFAGETLDFFFQHGVRLALCSNKSGARLRREVRHLGWGRYFVAVIGAQDAEYDKPHPAPVHLILRINALFGFGLEDIWFVGDTPTDMQCALCAGVLPVGVGAYAQDNRQFLPRLWAENLELLLTGCKQGLSSCPSLAGAAPAG